MPCGYKQYPSYRESGVEWLGSSPENWVNSKIKYIAPFQVGWTPPTKDERNFDGNNVWVTIGDLKGKSINLSKSLISDEAVKNASMEITPKGSLLFSFKLTVGEVGFAGKDLYTNEAIASFLDNKQMNLSYLYYAAPLFVLHNASVNIYGAKILNQDLIKNAYISIPQLQEQKSIANYLDKATTKIDTLIEKQTKLIALLKEKRQAVISSAVTRGLDASVPMKDSGVEWLGEIPEGWEVKKLKFEIHYIESGTSVNAANHPASKSDLGVLKTSSVYSGDFRYEENKTVVVEERDRVSCPLKMNTLIVSRMNTPELVGAAGFVTIAPSNIFLPDRLWQVSFSRCNTKFIHYLTLTNIYRSYIHTVCAGTSSSMQNLSQEDFRDFLIALPSKKEQLSIVNFVSLQTSKIDNLITKSIQAIDLLKEKRTALISAAVTGKIDVRDAA